MYVGENLNAPQKIKATLFYVAFPVAACLVMKQRPKRDREKTDLEAKGQHSTLVQNSDLLSGRSSLSSS
jgi:hypothetical protein